MADTFWFVAFSVGVALLEAQTMPAIVDERTAQDWPTLISDILTRRGNIGSTQG
jgi:hypothetical protein